MKIAELKSNIPKMIFVSATYTGQLKKLFTDYFSKEKNMKMIVDKKTHMNL